MKRGCEQGLSGASIRERVARLPRYAAAVARCRARLDVDWLNFPGQKRDEQGRWTDGFMSEAAMEAVADLVSIVDEIESNPTVEPSRLHGGQSAETLLFALPDGRKIVRKRAPEWGDPDAPRTNADAEQLGALVANALDVQAARVYRNDESTIWIEFVPGNVMGDQRVDFNSTSAGRRMGLLDVVISNPDRNEGNLIVDGEKLTGIDHGSSWFGPLMVADSQNAEDVERYSQPIYGAGPIYNDNRRPNSLFIDDSSTGRHWIDNPLSSSDVDETRTRLESLRPDFKRLGREAWLDYSLRTLDEIAPFAKGTESIYG
jgi:hypothetical protein